jgi:hypothetical protein
MFTVRTFGHADNKVMSLKSIALYLRQKRVASQAETKVHLEESKNEYSSNVEFLSMPSVKNGKSTKSERIKWEI